MSKAHGKRPWRGWYKLARWERRRQVQLAKQPLCEMCLMSEDITAADTADHIVPHRGDHDLFWFGELQSLCGSCHSRHKQNEELGKTVVLFGPDGWPL